MKMVEVMACVDRVAKNGTNASQGYKYAMSADVYDAVRSELAKRFILPCPNPTKWEMGERDSKSGGKIYVCTVQGTLDFLDAESGEVIQRPMFGQGSDSLDKHSYKALTGAMKNALVHQFLIPTGDDPEHEKPAPPPPPAGLSGVKARMPAPNISSAAKSAAEQPPPPTDADSPNAAPSRPHVPTSPPSHNRMRDFRFGNDKGKPIHELDQGSLRFYEGALKRDLASDDPAKQRYADSNRAALADVQAELRFKGFAANN